MSTAINHAPTGADNTITTPEDTAYTFAASDFGFSDPNDGPPNTLLAIEITTLPAAGTLTDNGVAVTAGQFIPVADIDGGLLVFAPAPDTNGSGYASFAFQVQDNGGTANGGVDLDPIANMITLNVTAINTAPVLTPQNALLEPITVEDTNNPGETVSFFLGSSIANSDAGAVQGIAITGVGGGDGQWQYSLDGSTWTDFGSVGVGSALVLDGSDYVRFVPNGQDATTASFTYRAWDETDGSTPGAMVDTTTNGGSSAFSTAEDTASIGVGNVLYNVHETALAGGGFAVAYTEFAMDSSGVNSENIYARVFDAGGTQIGSTIEVNDPNTVDDNFNLLTPLSNGDFAVTWQTGVNGDEIDTRVFDANGVSPAADQQVTAAPGNAALVVQTVALSNGDYAVLYDQTDANDNVYVQIYKPDGTAAGGPIVVDDPSVGAPNDLDSPYTMGDVFDHSFIAATQNGFAVTWASERPNPVNGGQVQQNVFVRAFDNSGAALTGEIQANGVETAGSFDVPTDIVALGSDNFALSWQNLVITPPSPQAASVYSRIFLSSDYTAGAPIEDGAPPAAPGASVDQSIHAVALTGGGYVAFWGTIDASTFFEDVYVQVYDANGNVAAGSQADGIKVNIETCENEPMQVLALAGGGFAVMWGEFDGRNPTTFIRAYAADGTAISAPVQVNPPDHFSDGPTEMVALADGGFDVFLLQAERTTPSRATHEDVLVQHVAANGALLGAPIDIGSTPPDVSGDTFVDEFRSALAGDQTIGLTWTDGDQFADSATAYSLAVQFLDQQPLISNPDTVVAASGAGPIALRIAAPSIANSNPLTITIDTAPSYGSLFYLDGATLVPVSAGDTLTAAQLASLEYTPPASGEFGGETISYTVTNGDDSIEGSIAVSVVADSAGPANLYFSAFGGPGNSGNPDLYTLDANGDPLAIPINAANGSFAGEDGGFVQYAGNLYFMASTPATGDALLEMTPDGTVTPVSDGAGGFFGDTFENANFTEFAGSLYFRALSADGGDQLVKLTDNGGSSPTVQTIVLTSGGSPASPGQLSGFTVFDGNLYFSAFTDASGGNNPDLIQLDAAGHITDISDLSGDASSAGEDGGFVVFNNTLYFNAFSNELGIDSLFTLAPGSTTPELVDPNGTALFHEFQVSSAFHEFNGSLYFNEFSSAVSDETLFKLDTNGTLTALTFNNGAVDEALENAGEFGGFTDFAGSTYFVATTPGEGTQLFKLDTSGDITQITNTSSGAFDDNLVSGFVQFAGSLYFDAYDNSGGDSLFKLDAHGVLTNVDLGGPSGSMTNAGVDGGFQVVNNALYFSAFTADGYELVKLNADGTSQVFDINPGPSDNSFDTAGAINALGVFPDAILNGGAGKDILVGSAANEILNGGAGNDVLEGRGGNDVLTGGDGDDVFQFSAAGPANVNTVTDYSLAQGDTLDVSALVDADFTGGSKASDFVRLIALDGDNLLLQVDPDGAVGGHVWQDVAILRDANILSVNQVTAFFGGADHTITQSTDLTAPVVNLSGALMDAVQGGGPISALAPSPTISDPEGPGTLDSATVTIANPQAGDTLAANTAGTSISAAYANGVLTLTGTDSLANYEQVFASVTYQDGGVDATSGGHPTRTLDWVVSNDALTSTVVTTALTIDRAPSVTNETVLISTIVGGTTTSSPTQSVLASGQASDLDGDSLMVTAVNGLTGNVGVGVAGADGTLTLSSTGGFTYQFTNGSGTSDSFTYTISDGKGGAANGTLTFDLPPSVTSINLVGSSPNNAGGDSFTVTFSKAVTGVDASDFKAITGGSAADTSLSITGSGTTYTVTANGVTGDGTLGLNLNATGTGIIDGLGNAIGAGFTGQVYTIDHTPPTVSSINIVGSTPNNASSDQFTVVFSESVTGVDAIDFTAITTGTAADTGLSITGSGTTYTVTANDAAGDGTLALNLNASGTGITDAAGNAISGGFTGQVYTIQHTPIFQANTPAASGPYSGLDQWSVATNWSTGVVPTSGDIGISNATQLVDDEASLSLGNVIFPTSGAATLTVNGGLTIGNLELGSGSTLLAYTLLAGGASSAPVTVNGLTNLAAGGTIEASGAGAFVNINGTDAGEIYQAQTQGKIVLSSAPTLASTFSASSGGAIGFNVAPGTIAASVTIASSGGVEVQGTTLASSSYIVSAHTETITTDAGTYVFTDWQGSAHDFVASIDASTGLLDLTAASTGSADNPQINNDANGDGMAGMFWQENGTGRVAVWDMNGTNYVDFGYLPDPGPTWALQASGDFNGDGKSDMIFEDTSGQIVEWLLNGVSIANASYLPYTGTTAWQVATTGDFNGDGISDLALQNTDGSLAIWELNGANIIANGASVVTNPGPNWQAIATGDFFGTNQSELVLQNTVDGSLQFMGLDDSANGPVLDNARSAILSPALDPGADWRLAGTGDFNGDGLSDFVFQNTDGSVAIWEMNGANLLTPTSAAVVGNPGSTWRLGQVGDFNGDGTSDLVFQDSQSGLVQFWQMNGLNVASKTTLTNDNPGTFWHPIA